MFKTPSRHSARQSSRPMTPSTPQMPASNGSNQAYNASISVSIRIKPSSSLHSHSALRHTDTLISVPEIGEFTFDNVFGPQVNNLQVYNSLVKTMVGKVMEGYNATVFAYGMTGSGKTHSMTGSDHELGVIPLAIEEMFELIALQPHNEFIVKASYLEIYNEKINDLLDPVRMDLKLRETAEYGIQVVGITEQEVRSSFELLQLIELGNENRKTDSTEYNLKSSRSHAIVQIRIISKSESNSFQSTLSLCDLAGSERATSSSDRRKEGSYINKSLLSLTNVIVKLSQSNTSSSTTGSATPRATSRPTSSLERQSATPSRRGSLATSSTPIGGRTPMRSGSSLSFGRSTSSLSNRKNESSTNTNLSSSSSTHIPYRDSKLTRLLQSSLSGDAIVGILCTVSSSAPTNGGSSTNTNGFSNSGVLTETINTLRFASRAKNIKLNAKKHELTLNPAEKDKMIEKLKLELSLKDAEIKELKKGKVTKSIGLSVRGTSSYDTNSNEFIELKEKLIELESENKILIENQTHLTRLLETRSYSSTILKNDIISQIMNNELNMNEIVVKLEELFKVKYLENEEYQSYVAHLENSLKLEISKCKTLKMNNELNEIDDDLNALVKQQKEEISDLSKNLQNKERIINFLKSTMRMDDSLRSMVNNEDTNENEEEIGQRLSEFIVSNGYRRKRGTEGDLSGVLETAEEEEAEF